MKFQKRYVLFSFLGAIVFSLVGEPFGWKFSGTTNIITFLGQPLYQWFSSGDIISPMLLPLAFALNFLLVFFVLGLLILLT